MTEIERIVVVTKQTALQELVKRMNSRSQARFYLKQNQVSFSHYDQSDDQYEHAIQIIKRQLPGSLKQQFIDREFLPSYQFDEHDLIITVGPDGLVINTAKYLTTQPILAINPDPERIDGILIPFSFREVGTWIEYVRQGKVPLKHISMIKATLNDGQELYAVNDLFIGARTHVSARYQLELGHQREQQSSSGIIISTGAGSTGWLRAITHGASYVASYFGKQMTPPDTNRLAIGWDSDHLWFTVREPFVSKMTQANLVFGQITPGQEMVVTSQMPDYGTIFSDGIETDYLSFNSGFIARIGLAERKAHLITRA